jgi:hypothetical protein
MNIKPMRLGHYGKMYSRCQWVWELTLVMDIIIDDLHTHLVAYESSFGTVCYTSLLLF